MQFGQCLPLLVAFWQVVVVDAGQILRAERLTHAVPYPTPHAAKLQVRQVPGSTGFSQSNSTITASPTGTAYSSKPTTWAYNQCTYNPSRVFKPLNCTTSLGLGQPSTYPGTTTSVCDCPDGNAYVLLSGGKTTEKNYQCSALWTAQGDLRVAIPTQCPTPEPSTTSTEPSTSIPTYHTTVTVKVDHPDRCWSTTLDFSSNYPVQTGFIAIAADMKNGWGARDAQWNISSNNGVELQNVRAPCVGGKCASWNGNQAYKPGNITQSPDKKFWTFSVTDQMQPTMQIVCDARGGNGNGTFDLTITSTPPCGRPLYCSGANWNFTVENWKDANVDEEFKSWALDLNPNAPTGTLTAGTYPTAKAMPRRDSDFGTLNGVVGLVGAFISIAAGGKSVKCYLLIAGDHGDCPGPPEITKACTDIPRWVFFMWQALWNFHGVNYALTGVLLSEMAPQLGQTTMIVSDFVKQKKDDMVTAILLSVLGSLATVIGIGIAIKGIGTAATTIVKAGEIGKAAQIGGAVPSLGRTASGASTRQGGGNNALSPGQTQPNVKPNANGRGDEITQVPPPPGTPAPGTQPAKPQDGVAVNPNSEVPLTQKPTGGKLSDSGYIGNAAFVCPGVMTGMANSIWQQVDKAPTTESKILMDQAAVGYYMSNHSHIIQQTNDALLTFPTGDVNTTNKLLDVMKGGAFIDVYFDSFIYQTAIAADVVSRQISNIWKGGGYNVYVSYTFLDDDEDLSKCRALKMGPQSVQYCGDRGVYWMASASIQYPPCVGPPNGLDKMLNYGIQAWWPTAASAKAYRILNPDPEANPPTLFAKDDTAFSNYVADWAQANTLYLLDLVGTTPGTWSFPVCDQGRNFWTYDWNKEGGFQPKMGYIGSSNFPWPCACGKWGSGTRAFWDALGLGKNDQASVANICSIQLLNIDQALEKKSENIGYNALVGGFPPKGTKISYGDCDTCTIDVPEKAPDRLCYIGEAGCQNLPPGKGDGCTPAWKCKKERRDWEDHIWGNGTETDDNGNLLDEHGNIIPG